MPTCPRDSVIMSSSSNTDTNRKHSPAGRRNNLIAWFVSLLFPFLLFNDQIQGAMAETTDHKKRGGIFGFICWLLPDFLCDETIPFVPSGDLTIDWLGSNCPGLSVESNSYHQLSLLTHFYYSTRLDQTKETNEALDKEDWLKGCSPCKWDGIACMGGRVIEIFLDGNKLKKGPLGGYLPEDLSGLKTLTGLNLKDNEIGGTFPSGVGKYLFFLDISNNRFDGTLPVDMVNTFTMHMNVSHNRFSGSVPTEMFDNLRLIDTLDISNNQLNGIFPESNNFKFLNNFQEFHLDHNDLTGSIPELLCQNNLERFSVDCSVSCSCCSTCFGDDNTAEWNQRGSS